jgi:predicted DNA-binding mobile mystery protein A
MKNSNQKLYLEQIDRKIKSFKVLKKESVPPLGWINALRSALGMSLQQLGKKLGVTPPSVKEMEIREKHKTITLKTLEDVAQALDMDLVYAFIPRKNSLKEMIKLQADKVAKGVVLETDYNMQLESQGNSNARIKKAIKERQKEIISKMPRYLWD